MKKIFKNAGYFLKEIKVTIQLNALSNVFSVLSIGLIFFIFAMVVSGCWVSSQVVEAIQEEAEISVYYRDGIGASGITQLADQIKAINGVHEVSLVNKDEAYNRMQEILGEEARVLECFDDNPFSPFIEVRINMKEIKPILEGLELISDIEHVRDNRAILERLQDISGVLSLLGYLVLAAVGISTLVIIAHIIRLGIYNNREQINTLRLLGAPEIFIALPFLLVGSVLTLGGGLLAATLAALSLKYVYYQMSGVLPFILLPSRAALTSNLAILLILLSTALGILGSVFGLASARKD